MIGGVRRRGPGSTVSYESSTKGRPKPPPLFSKLTAETDQDPKLVGRWLEMEYSGHFPRNLSGCSSTTNKDSEKVILFGGADGVRMSNSVWELAIQKGHTATPSLHFHEIDCSDPPPGRIHAHLFWVQSDLILIGGQGAGGHNYTDTWRLSFSRKRWAPYPIRGKAPGIESGWASVASPSGSEIFFFGEGQLWKLSVTKANGEWTELPMGGRIPSTMFGHTMVCNRNELISFGGIADDGRLIDEVSKYKISSGTWSLISVNKGPSPRAFACAQLLDDRLLMIFGGTDDIDNPFSAMFNNLQAFDIHSRTWFKYDKVAPESGRCMGKMEIVSSAIAGQFHCLVTGGNASETDIVDVFLLERVPESKSDGAADEDNEGFTEVLQFLDAHGYGHLKTKFIDEEVNDEAMGILKDHCSHDFLEALGLKTVGERLRFKETLQSHFL